MLRYGIIGFGGLGRVHLGNLNKINEERGGLSLCAICGTTREKFTESVNVNFGTVDCSNIDISNCEFYDDYKEMIDREKPDFVVSALPTYLHRDVAVYALSHGVNILSEKAMALTPQDCQAMIDAAKENNATLMIGHCTHFNKAYKKIKEYVDSGVYGRVYRAEFSRYSQTPVWTWKNWILDPKQSGGCLIDMHIHDVDLINYFFGAPNKIHSVSTSHKVECESVYSQYLYDDGKVILTNADWSLTQKFPFEYKTTVVFEKAVVVNTNDNLVIYTDDQVITPDVSGDEYYDEMCDFLDCVVQKRQSDIVKSDEALKSIKLALIEAESAKSGKTIVL